MNLGSMNLMKQTLSMEELMLQEYTSPNFGNQEFTEVQDFKYDSPPLS